MKQSVRNSTINKLRWKFVIVTMCLITVTFGILITANYYYTKYWEEESALEALEWYNENELAGMPIIERELFLDSYVNPIFSVDLNEEMEIINVTSSSTIGRDIPDGEEILSMINDGEDNRWESYIFVIKKHEDGYHMVLTDMSEGKAGLYRTIGTLCLILLGFGIMLVISIILSRFVTEPAKMALEREKQFVSDASHELKTPLSAISINAQALNAEFGDAVPEGSRHLDNIISETGRMNQLVQNLLKLSYIDEMSGDIATKEFDLSKCCEGMLLTMESVIYEKRIAFSYEIDEDIWLKGNEDNIKQLIAILIDNAIKNTPTDGNINFTLKGGISAGLKSGRVQIVVGNSGEGISEEDLPHIFERFYKADKSREGGSYGLGLAIAKSIAEAHRGTIKAESTYGKGARFIVEI